jgi:hypothetical protein
MAVSVFNKADYQAILAAAADDEDNLDGVEVVVGGDETEPWKATSQGWKASMPMANYLDADLESR